MKSLFTFFTNKGQLFALIIALVLIAIVFFLITGGLSNGGYSASTDLVKVMKDMKADESIGNSDAFNFFMPAVKIPLFFIGAMVLLLLFFFIRTVVLDPKGSMKFVIGLVVLGIIFFILYSMSPSETTGIVSGAIQKFDLSENISKLISGGIKTSIGLAIAAAAMMVLMEVWNLFK